MIQFVTLSTITHDLIAIIRGAQVTQSEPISLRQLESWVHATRARLIKQDLDKGKKPNPDYIQVINSLELEEVDEAYPSSISTDYKTFRTKLQIPNTLDLNFSSGLMYVGTITGEEIMFVPQGRVKWQQYKKYTGEDRIAYLKDKYLYVENDKEIRYISIRGIFEVPTEVSHLNNPNEVITDVTTNSPYPIPINMIPTLKEMILKLELGIEAQAPSDITNESASKIESPIKGDIRYTDRLDR